MSNRAYFVIGALLLFAFILCACGGGSSNSSNSNNNPTPSASAPPPSGNGGGSSTGGSSGGGSSSGGSSGGGSSSGGSGGGSGSAGTTAHFLYVYNASGRTIDGFDVNASNGALTPMSGSPFAAPENGTGLVATGGFVYASGGLNSAITAYAIGADGRITESGTIPTSGQIQYNLYAHASGKYIYGTTTSGDILGFQITAPGQLTPISGLPSSIGPDTSMTLSPDGKWAFVSYQQTSNGGAHVNTYPINSSTGAWGSPVVYPNAPVGVGGPPPQAGHQPGQVHLTVDPSSMFLFAANDFQNLVFAFRIGSDGSLSPVGSPNGTSSPGSSPFSLAATASFAYFGDFSQAKLYGYGYTNGALTPTPGSPYANVMAPAYSMKIDPTGRLLYVANNDPGSISVWSIAADGSLSQISGSPFSTPEMFGNNPLFIALQ